MHKKNLPPERNGSNLFLIYPTSHSLHWCHASLSVTQPSLPCSLRMYAETEQHCFYILLSGGFAWPSHPFALPQPHLLYTHTHTPPHTYPPFTFLPVKTSTGRCCYLPSFQPPVTSTSFSLLQKLSPTTFLDALPAVPNSCWEAQSGMSNPGRRGEPTPGSQ